MVAKLEFKDLTKAYGKTKVITNMSLQVEKGEFFVVLGPSGTGKSTLLKLIVGIEQPDSGKILIDGKDVTRLPPNKRNISMVFQNYALYPNMNVFQNIAFPLRMRRVGPKDISRRVREVAEKLGITEVLGKKVYQISGGQQQRVALARAIVRTPALFLMDEPLSNLDARVRYTARTELKKIQEEVEQTFLFVTHDQKEAEALGGRIGVIHDGKFEQIGTYNELYETPSTPWLGDFVGDFPMSFIGSMGFRPEWASVGKGDYSMTVDFTERVGDIFFLHGISDDKEQITLKGDKNYEAGERVEFSVKRHLSFEGRQKMPV